MKVQNFLILCIGLLILVLLSACYRLVPPPNHVDALVILKEDNAPGFFYWPNIIKEREFQRKHYYLSSVEIRETNCPSPRCERLVWELGSDAVGKQNQPAPGLVPLPKSIKYGEKIPGMRIDVPAENLEPGVTYSVVIGIMGLDKKYERRIYFSANAEFEISSSTW